MRRSVARTFQSRDSVVFLALWFHGGKVRNLAELIGLYDFVNREIPTAVELEGGLNRLLAAKLITVRREGFAIRPPMLRAFNAFRRRRRRNRFLMAEEFVKSFGPLASVVRRVTVPHSDWQSACSEYVRWIEEAASKLT